MKTCVFISCFDHYSTRIEVVSKYFLKKKYDIKYYYADFDHFTKKYKDTRYKYGTKIKVQPYKKNLSLKRLFSHYLFTVKVMKIVNKIKPDFIYCIVPPNYLVKKLSKYKKMAPNVRLVFDIYDLWPESLPVYDKKKFARKLLFFWKYLRSSSISGADLLITVSEQAKKSIMDEAKGTRIEVVKPTISKYDVPKYKTDVEELSFCYLGMVNHITDTDLAVNLLGEIAKKRKTHLHIIGEGQNLSSFVDRLKEKNVNVCCHGCIFDRTDKNRIIEMCNLGLNIPRKEIKSTMSLKAIEYMSAGLPFLNSALGDIRKIVSKDKIGINIASNDLEKTVNDVLSLSSDDFSQMHKSCLEAYREKFLDQDFDMVFGNLVE